MLVDIGAKRAVDVPQMLFNRKDPAGAIKTEDLSFERRERNDIHDAQTTDGEAGTRDQSPEAPSGRGGAEQARQSAFGATERPPASCYIPVDGLGDSTHAADEAAACRQANPGRTGPQQDAKHGGCTAVASAIRLDELPRRPRLTPWDPVAPRDPRPLVRDVPHPAAGAPA